MAKLLRYIFSALLAVVFALMLNGVLAVPHNEEGKKHDKPAESTHTEEKETVS